MPEGCVFARFLHFSFSSFVLRCLRCLRSILVEIYIAGLAVLRFVSWFHLSSPSLHCFPTIWEKASSLPCGGESCSRTGGGNRHITWRQTLLTSRDFYEPVCKGGRPASNFHCGREATCQAINRTSEVRIRTQTLFSSFFDSRLVLLILFSVLLFFLFSFSSFFLQAPRRHLLDPDVFHSSTLSVCLVFSFISFFLCLFRVTFLLCFFFYVFPVSRIIDVFIF